MSFSGNRLIFKNQVTFSFFIKNTAGVHTNAELHRSTVHVNFHEPSNRELHYSILTVGSVLYFQVGEHSGTCTQPFLVTP
jgi:hypothetical protein